LGRDRCRHRISGPRERHEEAVPLAVDLLPVSLGECITEDPLVFLEDLSVPAVAETLQERGGALNVGEKKSDCSGWKANHRVFLRFDPSHVRRSLESYAGSFLSILFVLGQYRGRVVVP